MAALAPEGERRMGPNPMQCGIMMKGWNAGFSQRYEWTSGCVVGEPPQNWKFCAM